VENINLKDIAQDVPVLLWFHGGGLTLGSCDLGFADKIMPLLEKQKQSSGSDSVPPLLLASVDYRLAPNHPLPAASVDSLSVVDYCLKNDEERKIHVSGESAGGYLSLVSAFAAQQHYPGRVQSALVLIPFLSPAADSMSCYMNGPSSIMVSMPWLRWCWRAALEMDEIIDGEDADDVLAVGSNRTAWNKSKWKQNDQWHKFMEPLKGIPSGLNDKETKYIVAVNKADPLYDDGHELMRKLKEAGADVDYVEAKGSHSIGFAVDTKGKEAMFEKWRAAIFVSQ
jgi:acetyl esterase/lipase